MEITFSWLNFLSQSMPASSSIACRGAAPTWRDVSFPRRLYVIFMCQQGVGSPNRIVLITEALRTTLQIINTTESYQCHQTIAAVILDTPAHKSFLAVFGRQSIKQITLILLTKDLNIGLTTQFVKYVFTAEHSHSGAGHRCQIFRDCRCIAGESSYADCRRLEPRRRQS